MSDYLQSPHFDRIANDYKTYTKDSKLLVDKVFKYEKMSEALEEIAREIDLKETLVLPNERAKSTHRKDRKHYSEVLSEAEIQLVQERFWFSIEQLNYEF